MRHLRVTGDKLAWRAKLVEDYDIDDRYHKSAMLALQKEIMELAVVRDYYIDRETLLEIYDTCMSYQEKNMSMEDYNFAKAREAWATPVKIVQYNCTCGRTMKFESEHGVVAPQRTWVGLTHEEIASIGYNNHPLDGVRSFARAIEAKLKEKNT